MNTLPDEVKNKIYDKHSISSFYGFEDFKEKLDAAMEEYAKAYAPVPSEEIEIKINDLYIPVKRSDYSNIKDYEIAVSARQELRYAAHFGYSLAAPVPGKEEEKSLSETFKELRESRLGKYWDSVICVCRQLMKDYPCECHCKEFYDESLPNKHEDKAVQQAAKEYEQDFKELNIYLNDIYHNHIHNVKDAGNLWIQFTDKFNAFKKKVLAGASFNSDAVEVHVHGISKQKSDAVEFAEWIAIKEYITTTLPHEDVQLWQHNHYDRENDKLTEGPEITTKELYNLFLKNKNSIQQAHDKAQYE